MKYIKECVFELKKAIFPSKKEMKKYMAITVSTLIVSSLFLYLIGAAVLEIFSKIYS